MKIEIFSDIDPARDMQVIADGTTVHQPGIGMFSRYWDIDDLSKLLGDKQIEKLIAGEFSFTVPTWKIRLLQHKIPAKTNEHLKFISQW